MELDLQFGADGFPRIRSEDLLLAKPDVVCCCEAVPICCGVAGWPGGRAPSALRVAFTGATDCGCIMVPTANSYRTVKVDSGELGTYDLVCIDHTDPDWVALGAVSGCRYVFHGTGIPLKAFLDALGANQCDPADDAGDPDADELVVMIDTGTMSDPGVLRAFSVAWSGEWVRLFEAPLPAGWFAGPYPYGPVADTDFCEPDPFHEPFAQAWLVIMAGATASITLIP